MEIRNNEVSINHDKIKGYLQEKYSSVIKKYINQKDESDDEQTNIIWMCWWQGLENAPYIVKICYENIKKYSTNKKVILITQENYREYVNIPDYIIEKLQNGIISITHFSDVLRASLLNKYGGIWMDATCFLTDNIFEDINSKFYSVKLPHNDDEICISDGKWCIFFMSCTKNSILFKFLEDFLNTYWKNENSVIDYFLTDYIISIAYDNISDVKKIIDEIPENNVFIHTLKEKLNDEFNQNEYEQLLKCNKIHKLAHERKYITNLPNGKETFYGYITKK